MLNPESIDYNNGRIKILFTDDDAEKALTIYLTEEDGWRLHEMIVRECNMKAKQLRRQPETIDYNF